MSTRLTGNLEFTGHLEFAGHLECGSESSTMIVTVRKMTESRRPILDLIVIDCPDALELARFYSTLLGWTIEPGADRDWPQ